MHSHEDGSREKQTSDNQRGEDEASEEEAEWMRHRAIKDKEVGKIQVGTFHSLTILNTRDSSATIMAPRWRPVSGCVSCSDA